MIRFGSCFLLLLLSCLSYGDTGCQICIPQRGKDRETETGYGAVSRGTPLVRIRFATIQCTVVRTKLHPAHSDRAV